MKTYLALLAAAFFALLSPLCAADSGAAAINPARLYVADQPNGSNSTWDASQRYPKKNTLSPADAYTAQTFDDGRFILNYRIYAPRNITAGEKIPLVLLLHGAGERGFDNVAQLKHGAKPLLEYVTERNIPAIIVVPQCPANMKWSDVDWGADTHSMPLSASQPMRATLKLLDKLGKDYPVDPDRIYVTGLSMGGYGTWDVIQRYPRKFAAAIPVCGGGDAKQVSQLRKMPIWAFHGALDPVVRPQRSREMVEAIKARGGNPKYTEFANVKHNSWVRAYGDPATFDWLFAQKRGVAPTAD